MANVIIIKWGNLFTIFYNLPTYQPLYLPTYYNLPTYLSSFIFNYLLQPTYPPTFYRFIDMPTYPPINYYLPIYLTTHPHTSLPTYLLTHPLTLTPSSYNILPTYFIISQWCVEINMWNKKLDKTWTPFDGVVHWLKIWFIIGEVKGFLS
jgi:hypothetical protein